MILIDFTQIAIGSLMVALNRSGEDVDDALIRHLVLNNLRYYRSKFTEEYGELVICCDSKHYWRRDYFPHYKANRKKDRASSGYDWNFIFESLNSVRDEIKTHFPYKVLEIYGAEADDIIATLVKSNDGDAPNLIVSSDKDFIQLHGYNVKQYSPVSKKLLNGSDPVGYLREHIFKGDRSDGVPNVLSADDTFVAEKRQKPMRKTTLATLTEAMNTSDAIDLHNLAKCPRDTWIRNYQRNETLIDLTKIPNDIENEILNQFGNTEVGDRSKLFNYFVEKKLNNLIQSIGDF